MKVCKLEGCNKRRHGHHLCPMHHMREWKWGDPNYLPPPKPKPPVDHSARFWSRVDIGGADECWIWRGTVLPRGYGQYRVGDKKLQAHRFAYMDKVGPIPPDLTIDHLCCVKLCVNPSHMEIVTGAENTSRRWERERGIRP